MQTIKITDFYDEFRPYNETEALEAIKRFSENSRFKKIFFRFFPEKDEKSYYELINSISSVYDFQVKIMHEVADRVVKKTITELNVEGLDLIEKDKNYVFLSNHRDIVWDAYLFQYILVDYGFDTNEITFGNNLMEDTLVLDVGKTNKMFKVYRKGSPKELLKKTLQLSEYIRYALFNKKQSIWIAQRGGRTKDGNDRTHSGVIKMLNASGTKSFEENIRELNITPLSVSYEFEPNDYLKVNELLNTVNGKYEKAPGEDIKSIVDATFSNKGRVNIAVCGNVNDHLYRLKDISRTNTKIAELAKIIDNMIFKNYRLYPNNFIAFDLLNNTNRYRDKYSKAEKNLFIEYKNGQLDKINNHSEKAETLFLKIYANPVINVNNSV